VLALPLGGIALLPNLPVPDYAGGTLAMAGRPHGVPRIGESRRQAPGFLGKVGEQKGIPTAPVEEVA
jgi:hypothetical protein